jgi:precorrin-6B methylase 2
MNPSIQRYIDFQSTGKPQWLMGPDERLVILGLMDIIKPEAVLEIGHCHGGCTGRLAQKAKKVYSVDIDVRVIENCKQWTNVTPLHMKSSEAFEKFRRENRRFDLVIIDGDHSEAGAYEDLKASLSLCDFIIMHDTSNPDCRAGYTQALAGQTVYYVLDLVEGCSQEDGLWGGIGIVIPPLSKQDAAALAPKISNYEIIKAAFNAEKRGNKKKHGLFPF